MKTVYFVLDCMRPVLVASPIKPSIRRLLKGAIAGFMATVPMSATMLLGWGLLPKREKYPLPPRLITEEITKRMQLEEHLNEESLIGLTIVSHFGYGALIGSIYALFERWVPGYPSFKGVMTGIAIWVGSYLGWLPAMRILSPATQHPWRRNLLMIVAHVIWGVTLGEGVRKLSAN